MKDLGNSTKINYDRKFQDTIASVDGRPRLLVHTCCAPCSTASLERASEGCDVTVYFYNGNIHPRSEYELRLAEQIRFIEEFNTKYSRDIKIIVGEYKPEEFKAEVVARGLQDEPERGARCDFCFDLRLAEASRLASELGFDYFATSLTLSPMKNTANINELGLRYANYLPSDFKKRGGYNRSVELSEEFGIYRQGYCGCVFGALKQGVDPEIFIEE
ncbi:MAG: epoxyqueuosine reductase QueH [Lactobacillales bacterium]|jgi:predicted adenine nucleotide alpha hydrolase (AANH) superfamily ATPase|nr:epoxyqueuosine reductase QueH [Lactobacillales bacterium]